MSELVISLANGAPEEAVVRDALLGLRAEHDLARFEWTHDVVIDRGAIPRSHPTLTLSCRYGKGDDRLLAVYLHEQLHYWSMQCPGAVDGRDEAVYDDLRSRYPLPVGAPEGCRDELSNLIHLHVCWLELEVTSLFLGRECVESLLRSKDYYRAVYRTVLDNAFELASRFEDAGMGVPRS